MKVNERTFIRKHFNELKIEKSGDIILLHILLDKSKKEIKTVQKEPIKLI